ncbi:hypothetical protein DLJ53_18070 [Acuticoccus sediminis]|uniref:Uncharacterized protein n=1 Tax=Acuticoccus sediminis TaxID=2184697 RepID=A0A8B2NVD4_9HYPH|nr:hypothetical protein [Acuticoccus sediminis]RAI01123.1 hypothetical protein DLJ53_18070 [Acuticoccus sediminis]
MGIQDNSAATLPILQKLRQDARAAADSAKTYSEGVNAKLAVAIAGLAKVARDGDAASLTGTLPVERVDVDAMRAHLGIDGSSLVTAALIAALISADSEAAAELADALGVDDIAAAQTADQIANLFAADANAATALVAALPVDLPEGGPAAIIEALRGALVDME